MKKIGLLSFVSIVVFGVISVNLSLAQAPFDECSAIYQIVFDNRNGPDIKKLRLALSPANDYLKKCGEVNDQEHLKTYVTGEVPKIEERIKAAELKIAEDRYYVAFRAKNYEEMLPAAKELLKLDRPYSLDLMLDMATMGYDHASARPAVNKYNDEAILYAKQSLQKMSEGKVSGNDEKYGYYGPYKTPECSDGKSNATGWMNFIIGYITFVGRKQPQDALPYLFKATQTGCATKTNSEAYRLIGNWYFDETMKINATRMEKIKAAGDKDTDETLALLAIQKGYVERSMDAFPRGYKFANADKNRSQTYKDSLRDQTRELFDFRFDGDVSKFDAYLASAASTTLVDPVTPVTPIKEEPQPNTSKQPKIMPDAPAKPKSSKTVTKTGVKTKSTKAPSQKRPRKTR